MKVTFFGKPVLTLQTAGLSPDIWTLNALVDMYGRRKQVRSPFRGPVTEC
jgi:hypothetical protein